jgi:enterochelin esterase-like enzyme
MLKKNRNFLLAFLVIIFTVLIIGCTENKDKLTFPENIPQGSKEIIKFASPYTGNDLRTVNVYLTNGVDKNEVGVYPVLYLLHGIGGNENSWYNDNHNIAEILDELVYYGKINPMIVVMPNGSNGFSGSFFVNSLVNPDDPKSGGFGLYEWYITGVQEGDTNSVIGRIEKLYPAINKSKRAIAGVSMGGYGATYLMLKHPDLFKVVASLSGPLDISEFVSNALVAPPQYNIRQRLAGENSGRSYINVNVTANQLRSSGRLTSALIAMSIAFSPKISQLANYPISYFDTQVWINSGRTTAPIDSTKMYQYPFFVYSTGTPIISSTSSTEVCLGISLPVTFKGKTSPLLLNEPVENSTELVSDVVQRWLNYYDCKTLVNNASVTLIDLLKTKKIYLDCGLQDDLNPSDDNWGFGFIKHNQNFSTVLTAKGIPHFYEEYTGTHSSQIYWRAKVMAKFISDNM